MAALAVARVAEVVAARPVVLEAELEAEREAELEVAREVARLAARVAEARFRPR